MFYNVFVDKNLTKELLSKLNYTMNRFTLNTQFNPPSYETNGYGIRSTGDLVNGGIIADFGTVFHADHHLHYCYYVPAIAIIAQIDRNLTLDHARM